MLIYLFHKHRFSWPLMTCPGHSRYVPPLTEHRAQRPFAELFPASTPFPSNSLSCPHWAGPSPSALPSDIPFILSEWKRKCLYVPASPGGQWPRPCSFLPFPHLFCFPFCNSLFPSGGISVIFPHFSALWGWSLFWGFLGEHRLFVVTGRNIGHALMPPSSRFRQQVDLSIDE